MIAVSHPGKHGDTLYALPAIRALCEKHGAKADFYTSAYCEPLRALFEAQDCIAHFYVAPNYVIERMDIGVQPWYVPVDENLYEATYHLGFRRVPDCAIPEFIAREAGVRPYPIRYDFSPEARPEPPAPYLVIAPRQSEDYAPLFQDIINRSPYSVIIVGGSGDGGKLGGSNLIDYCGQDYLNTAFVISKSMAFVGLMSSQLCLANGFPIPRIAPHDGHSWDMTHVVRSEYNYYPVKSSAETVLRIIEQFNTGI